MKPRLMIIVLLVTTICFTSASQTGDLPRSAPQEQGVDPQLIDHFVDALVGLPDVDIHHLMILRHGKVIAEQHVTPYRATDTHLLYSASKTVTALAVGLAIDDGLLTVDDKVSKHLRDKMPTKLSPALDSLTVRNMLMMATGQIPDVSIFLGDEDWLSTWFAREFKGVGQQFRYDSMCTHALAAIVTRLTGKPLLEYVQERIFTPLHITQVDWELAPDSIEAAGWGLRLQTESEAKLGQFMLQGGEWNGKQLVSSQWIHDMSQRLITTDEGPEPELSWKEKILKFMRTIWHEIRSWFTGYNIDDYYLGYGYQTKSIQQPQADSFFATGYGGQLIDVIPKLDMVIVINGRAANYGVEVTAIYNELIVPLINGEIPQANANPRSLAIELPQGEATSPWEKRLFAGRIELDEDNLLGLQSIKVAPQGQDRIFTMTDWRSPLRAVAACGEWRITTSDERPIYIMEEKYQLAGFQSPFTSAAAYAWQGDTLSLRLDWLDGGDNRRLKMVFGDDNQVTVYANDNFDPLLNDTIPGKLL